MTVSSASNDTRYTGNGVTTVFSTGFKFFDPSTLRVSTIVTATGIETVLTLVTNYTVLGGVGAIGSVTLLGSPIDSTMTLVIKRIEPYTQLTDLQENDPFPADVIETTFDKLEMQIQQVNTKTITAIQAPASFNPNTTAPYVMPAPVAGEVVVGAADGMGWTMAAIADLSLASIPVVISGLANGNLLRYNSGSTSWENKTLAVVLADLLTTRGDIIIRDSGGVTRLGHGTAGQILSTDGTDVIWTSSTVATPVLNTYAANADLTTHIPADDTVPQITEGTQIFSQAFTAANAAHRVRIKMRGHGATAGGSDAIGVALFVDGGTNAVASSWATTSASDNLVPLTLDYEAVLASGTHTFTVRVGANAQTVRMNGNSSTRWGNGTFVTKLTIEELLAP